MRCNAKQCDNNFYLWSIVKCDGNCGGSCDESLHANSIKFVDALPAMEIGPIFIKVHQSWLLIAMGIGTGIAPYPMKAVTKLRFIL